MVSQTKLDKTKVMIFFESRKVLNKKLLFFAFFIFCSTSLCAQKMNGDTGAYYNIRCPKLARPLMERWIAEYSKVNPEVQLRLAKGCSSGRENMRVIVRRRTAERGRSIMYFGQYAMLPITTQGSDAEKLLNEKPLSIERLKKVFFDKSAEDYEDEYEVQEDNNSPTKNIVVYSGNDTTSLAGQFAAFFGETVSNIRGKRISGDDAFLNNAIADDPMGVTFNALSNIYDLQRRKLKDNLSLLRLNIEGDVADVIRNDASLDDMIAALEQSDSESVPTAEIGIEFDNSDGVARDFLQWVISQGTKYNHQYGMLTLNERIAMQQAEKVRNRDTAQK